MSTILEDLKILSKDFSILYVEDDPSIRRSTKKVFENFFKTVDVASDGVEALEKYTQFFTLHSQNYDIVISDILMPHLNGIELIKEILKRFTEQKVIMISAYNDKEYFIELINIGVDAFLEKPLQMQTTIRVLYNVCLSCKQEHMLELGDAYTYEHENTALLHKEETVILSEHESVLLKLFIDNNHHSFNCIDIFNHLYFNEPDKEFSQDAIKSLIKRLRKKLPKDLIKNVRELGYSINLKS